MSYTLGDYNYVDRWMAEHPLEWIAEHRTEFTDFVRANYSDFATWRANHPGYAPDVGDPLKSTKLSFATPPPTFGPPPVPTIQIPTDDMIIQMPNPQLFLNGGDYMNAVLAISWTFSYYQNFVLAIFQAGKLNDYPADLANRIAITEKMNLLQSVWGGATPQGDLLPDSSLPVGDSGPDFMQEDVESGPPDIVPEAPLVEPTLQVELMSLPTEPPRTLPTELPPEKPMLPPGEPGGPPGGTPGETTIHPDGTIVSAVEEALPKEGIPWKWVALGALAIFLLKR